MLRIRLARAGAKKKSTYRVVVIEGAKARNGRFIEIVGHYNARQNPAQVVLNHDRVSYWLGRGAQPSETIRSLLKKKPQAAQPAAS